MTTQPLVYVDRSTVFPVIAYDRRTPLDPPVPGLDVVLTGLVVETEPPVDLRARLTPEGAAALVTGLTEALQALAGYTPEELNKLGLGGSRG